MSQLSHAQFPLRRHPRLLVDHRRAGTASVADSRGANAERLTGSGGRHQIGTVAGFRSERWPASNRNRWPDCVGIRKRRLEALRSPARHPLKFVRFDRAEQRIYMCEGDARAAGDRAADNSDCQNAQTAAILLLSWFGEAVGWAQPGLSQSTDWGLKCKSFSLHYSRVSRHLGLLLSFLLFSCPLRWHSRRPRRTYLVKQSAFKTEKKAYSWQVANIQALDMDWVLGALVLLAFKLPRRVGLV
jgi:hypothetical protein